MTALPRRVEVAVVGAGQAGLTMSWHLQQGGRDHVLLESRGSLGGAWQDRWDEFRLVGPNWTASFAGAPYEGDDPDGFMPRDEIVDRVAGYAKRIGAPVVLGAGVERVRSRWDGGFELETAQGPLVAAHVVVATGGFHRPHVPAIAEHLPGRVLSLHAHHYRREADMPPGAVLVIGSGQTGVQLVEELRVAGREVYLCVGSAGRAPRRYRGRDIFYWLWQLSERGEDLGTPLPTVDSLPDPRRRLAGNPHLSGQRGGHDTDLREIGREGTTLLGRLNKVDGERVGFAGDLDENLAWADSFFDDRIRPIVDRFITAAGIDSPPAEASTVVDYQPPPIEQLDLGKAGISTVLWTTGYRQDLRWIDLPITDELGFARQDRGVSEVEGLYFLGSLWQHDQTSATLVGLQRDARVLAGRMRLATG